MVLFRSTLAAALLRFAWRVAAQAHDEHDSYDMDDMKLCAGHPPATKSEVDKYSLPNYFSLDKHSNMMLAHIVLMVLAWFFILPIGESSLG